MKCIIGLGNPGSVYQATRHNLGFQAIDRLSETIGFRFRAGSGDYYMAQGAWRGTPLALAKPTTYVNDSGTVVLALKQEFGLALSDLLVICDDTNLVLGTIRFRHQGTDGGHKGLASIIYHLSSHRFPRLRLGVGAPSPLGSDTSLARHVLAPFGKNELPIVDDMILKAAAGCVVFIESGIVAAMNQFNVRSAQETPQPVPPRDQRVRHGVAAPPGVSPGSASGENPD